MDRKFKRQKIKKYQKILQSFHFIEKSLINTHAEYPKP